MLLVLGFRTNTSVAYTEMLAAAGITTTVPDPADVCASAALVKIAPIANKTDEAQQRASIEISTIKFRYIREQELRQSAASCSIQAGAAKEPGCLARIASASRCSSR